MRYGDLHDIFYGTKGSIYDKRIEYHREDIEEGQITCTHTSIIRSGEWDEGINDYKILFFLPLLSDVDVGEGSFSDHIIVDGKRWDLVQESIVGTADGLSCVYYSPVVHGKLSLTVDQRGRTEPSGEPKEIKYFCVHVHDIDSVALDDKKVTIKYNVRLFKKDERRGNEMTTECMDLDNIVGISEDAARIQKMVEHKYLHFNQLRFNNVPGSVLSTIFPVRHFKFAWDEVNDKSACTFATEMYMEKENDIGTILPLKYGTVSNVRIDGDTYILDLSQSYENIADGFTAFYYDPVSVKSFTAVFLQGEDVVYKGKQYVKYRIEFMGNNDLFEGKSIEYQYVIKLPKVEEQEEKEKDTVVMKAVKPFKAFGVLTLTVGPKTDPADIRKFNGEALKGFRAGCFIKDYHFTKNTDATSTITIVMSSDLAFGKKDNDAEN